MANNNDTGTSFTTTDNVVYTIAPPPPDPESSDKTFFINWDEGTCWHCYACKRNCPTGAYSNVVRIDSSTDPNPPDPTQCMRCGQCLINCKGGAINEGVSFVNDFNTAIQEKKIMVAIVAPSVRYALGEAPFGDPPQTQPSGTNVEKKMWAALNKLGFKYLYDNQFAAALTTRIEGEAFYTYIKNKPPGSAPTPLLSSCCPAWVKYMRAYDNSKFAGNISTCRSPMIMLGALAKKYLAGPDNGIDPASIYTVAIMPCIAKKYEGLIPENFVNINGQPYRNIDATIDTRELAWMIQDKNIDFANLTDRSPDIPPYGKDVSSTVPGTIFATSGGVTEAVLRYVYGKLGLQLPDISVLHGTGTDKKELSLNIGGAEIRICAINGLKNAIGLDFGSYDFIEGMACPNGCINGGGQPIHAPLRNLTL